MQNAGFRSALISLPMPSILIDIFNDVLGPVMRGPSSSHCAAALRIGRIARDLVDGELSEVVVAFDRAGSLPTTHASHGSDLGLCGGLLGWAADDDRLPGSVGALREAGIRLRFETADFGDPHPNTYRLRLRNAREEHTLIAVSTGGGAIEVIDVDGMPIRMDGGWHETLVWLPEATPCPLEGDEVVVHDAREGVVVQVKGAAFVPDEALAPLRPARVRRIAPVLPVASRRGVRVPFTTCAEMRAFDRGRATPVWELAVLYERARGGMDEREVLDRAIGLARILRRSMAQGCAGTSRDDRVLGCQSRGFDANMRAGALLDAGALNRIVLYVTAMMEVKSAMGVIVAMPTAGACAALPGAVIGMAETMGLGEEAMARAFLAAGLIGVFVASAWSFAAEAGGCQAECGVASAMAATGLVTLAGGTRDQAVAAASMALQNVLGLVCDPVANRVEVPCLGRNVMAAANALACANMALSAFDPVIPLDEVIDAAKRIAKQMPRELRCTGLGGLSTSPTSQHIEARLAGGVGRRTLYAGRR